MAQTRPEFLAKVQQILAFYGGKPVRGSFEELNGRLGTTGPPGSDYVKLAAPLEGPLAALFAAPRSEKAVRGGAEALATLLHEGLHTRGPLYGGEANVRDASGFFGWEDEWQARQLAGSLFPDLAQRFFGIDPNSKLGKLYEGVGRGSGYTSDLGAPPKGSVFANRSTRW